MSGTKFSGRCLAVRKPLGYFHSLFDGLFAFNISTPAAANTREQPQLSAINSSATPQSEQPKKPTGLPTEMLTYLRRIRTGQPL
jgi:hypothetical protein